MQTFKELQLNPLLQKGVDSAGYEKPFPIQERAIAPLLSGRNVIGQAKTGSGKTAAFGIPLLQSIDSKSTRVQAIVLAPTRELAVQITAEVKKLGAYTGTRVVTIYGGQSINVQFEALRHGVQVIVGTPGRVIDHIKRGSLHLDDAKFVVIDEADTMLDMGFIDDVEFILDCTSRERQLSLFSATMPEPIVSLARKYMGDAEKIIIDPDDPSVETLEQFYAVVEQGEKYRLLVETLERLKPTSTVVFCRTRYRTRRLARELESRFLSVVPLHGDLSQQQRDHSMSNFRAGNADVLVATDVASRGLDMRRVDLVVNFDVPRDTLLYFHRNGRTARAGDLGRAYTFVSPEEFEDFGRIVRMSRPKIKPLRPEDATHDFRSIGPGNDGARAYRHPRPMRGGRYGRRRRRRF